MPKKTEVDVRPVRVYDIPEEEAAYWGALDDRISCARCKKKSGWKCTATGRTHVPIGLKHRCDHYEKMGKP